MQQEATTQPKTQPKTRNKPSALANRAVMTHLTQSEFQQLDQVAQQEMRSISSTVRLLLNQALQQQTA